MFLQHVVLKRRWKLVHPTHKDIVPVKVKAWLIFALSLLQLRLNCIQLCWTYLYSGFCEFCPLSQLFSGVDVRVMRSLKSFLQLLQLLRCEGGAAAPLLPLQGQIWLRINIRSFVCAVTWGVEKPNEYLVQRTLGKLVICGKVTSLSAF